MGGHLLLLCTYNQHKMYNNLYLVSAVSLHKCVLLFCFYFLIFIFTSKILMLIYGNYDPLH